MVITKRVLMRRKMVIEAVPVSLVMAIVMLAKGESKD